MPDNQPCDLVSQREIERSAVVDRSGGPQQELRALREPADLLVVAAGGPAGGFGAIIPPWLGSKAQAVTHVIDEW